MHSRPPPRHQGKISAWKDEQGFGFIAPNGGGPAVFVHISAFPGRMLRPVPGDVVTYQLGTNERGELRAERAAFVLSPATRQAPRGAGSGPMPVLLVLGFFGFLAACVFTGKLPPMVIGVYLGMSLVAYLAYSSDKSAARQQRWRTREDTLHALGLLGGWPGALLARHLLRHKSSKASFRLAFWFTVVLNCAALAWLLAPSRSGAVRALLG